MYRPLTYLACPYSHPDPVMRRARFDLASLAAARLLKMGHIVFSPITHYHPMHEAEKLPGNWEFWSQLDKTYLKLSHMMIVLTLDGWENL